MNSKIITRALSLSISLLITSASVAGCVGEPVDESEGDDITSDVNTSEQHLWSSAGQIRSGVGASGTLCLEPQGGSLTPGAFVVVNTCSPAAAAQKWTMTQDGYLRSAASPEYCLDGGGSTANGTKLRVNVCNGSNGQRFEVSPFGELRTMFAPAVCLDVTNANAAPGAYVQLYQCNTTSAQRWFSLPPTSNVANQFLPIEVSGVGFNGGSNMIVGAAKGQALSLGFTYKVTQNAGCPACIDQIMVGWANPGSFQGCAYNGIPAVGGTSGQASLQVVAPATPGVYYLRFNESLEYSCSSLAWSGTKLPGEERNIAVITVN